MRRRHIAEQVACLVVESGSSSSSEDSSQSEDSDSSDESYEPIGLQSVQISNAPRARLVLRQCGRVRRNTAIPHNSAARQNRNTINWKRQDSVPQIHPFIGNSGLLVHLTMDTSPLEIFTCFFPNELLQLIVTETNAYAHNHPPPPLQPGKQHHDIAWKDCTVNEVTVVLG